MTHYWLYRPLSVHPSLPGDLRNKEQIYLPARFAESFPPVRSGTFFSPRHGEAEMCRVLNQPAQFHRLKCDAARKIIRFLEGSCLADVVAFRYNYKNTDTKQYIFILGGLLCQMNCDLDPLLTKQQADGWTHTFGRSEQSKPEPQRQQSSSRLSAFFVISFHLLLHKNNKTHSRARRRSRADAP